MKIVVCIKQIPDTNDVKWSSDNNIIREGVISVLNPYDVYGILSAKRIENSKITLLSMGPAGAIEALRYGLALGADEGILLSDKRFSGSDTLSTAKTLACAVKNVIKDYDLIITGQFALDGDTSQTPYSLSNFLQIPIAGYVKKIEKNKEGELELVSIKDDGVYKIKAKTPLVVAVSCFEGKPYKPKAIDYIRAQQKEIKVLDANSIFANCDEIGIKGSPTCVKEAFRPRNKRECKFIDRNLLIGELK